jgi:hypothetical protein
MSNPTNYEDRQPHGTDSPNNTYFRASEAPPHKQRKFQRLWYYNEDLKVSPEQYSSEEIWRRDGLSVLDAIASTLDLTDAQKDRARAIVESTDITEESGGNYSSVEAYCFAACVVAFNDGSTSDSGVNRVYLPRRDDSKNPQHFVAAQKSVGLSKVEIAEAMESIKS